MRRVPQLVRDDMPPRPDTGEEVRLVDGPLRASLLVGKLHSEVEEVARDLTNPEEYGDVLEALYALAKMNGLSPDDVQAARLEKRRRKGGLDGGAFWVSKEFL